MINGLLGYPGKIVYPYIGIGEGMSSHYLLNMDIRAGSSRSQGWANAVSGAYQFFGVGIRISLASQYFAFSEYKYVSSRPRWKEDGQNIRLRNRVHILLAGVGLRF